LNNHILLLLICLSIIAIILVIPQSLIGTASAHCFLNEISGIWKGNDGGTYYIQQDGDRVWWIGASSLKEGTDFSNVFEGQRDNDIITGKWADVPMGKTQSNGELSAVCNYVIGGDDTLTITSNSGGFGGTVMSKPGTSYVTVNPVLTGFGPNDKKLTLCMYTFIPPSIRFVDADPNCVEVSSGVSMKFSLKSPGFVDYDIQDRTALKIGGKSCLGYIYPEQSRECTLTVQK